MFVIDAVSSSQGLLLYLLLEVTLLFLQHGEDDSQRERERKRCGVETRRMPREDKRRAICVG